MTCRHFFQFRFGATEPFKLCLPPHCVNIGNYDLPVAFEPFLGAHAGLRHRGGARHLPHGVLGLRVFGVVSLYLFAVIVFITHHPFVLGLGEGGAVASLDLPKRYHSKDIHVGYVITAFIALVYASFPVYTDLFPMSTGSTPPMPARQRWAGHR